MKTILITLKGMALLLLLVLLMEYDYRVDSIDILGSLSPLQWFCVSVVVWLVITIANAFMFIGNLSIDIIKQFPNLYGNYHYCYISTLLLTIHLSLQIY